MSDQSHHIHDAATFAENVRRELRNLSAEVVADLTDGLESDIAASLADGATLPDASVYAQDLVRGAGLENAEGDVSSRQLLRSVKSFGARHWGTVQNLTAGLAPAWWVLRAWVATQVIGWLVSDSDSSRPVVAQWGEMPFVGLLIFAALLALSIKWGRSTPPRWKKVIVASHVVLAITAFGVAFAEPHIGWFTYAPADNGVQQGVTNSPAACFEANVPDVSGRLWRDAEVEMNNSGLAVTFVSNGAIIPQARIPEDAAIDVQDPSPGRHIFCAEDSVQLSLNLFPDRSMPGIATTMPPETSSSTVPKKTTTTTVAPKSPTTTRP